ncbi:MAG TPA: response regulator transcription factor [Chryseolinea sp.]|jgi:DNA-binding NarL/FixJ family response regulator|nr:response regulator transcription factor [Chryseolinea sp.]
MNTQTVRVSIYEDNAKLRDLLELLIGNTEGFAMAGSYPDCTKVAADIKRDHPDVVIMDIDMPGRSGIEGVQLIKEIDISIRVVMHTVFDDDDRLFNCLTNGADGYLLKKDSWALLVNAIREVYEGGAPMSPGIATRVLKAFRQTKQSSKNDYHITEREHQVLELLARGFSYRMIGIEFSISPETVKRHLKNIYQKLHVQCGPEAVAKAIREKII